MARPRRVLIASTLALVLAVMLAVGLHARATSRRALLMRTAPDAILADDLARPVARAEGARAVLPFASAP